MQGARAGCFGNSIDTSLSPSVLPVKEPKSAKSASDIRHISDTRVRGRSESHDLINDSCMDGGFRTGFATRRVMLYGTLLGKY